MNQTPGVEKESEPSPASVKSSSKIFCCFLVFLGFATSLKLAYSSGYLHRASEPVNSAETLNQDKRAQEGATVLAILNGEMDIHNVPLLNRTKAMCLAAIAKGSFLAIPEEVQDKEIAIAVAKSEPILLSTLRADLIDEDVVEAAVRTNPARAVIHIPSQLKTDRILCLALERGQDIFLEIPQTKATCKKAVEQNPAMLGLVPKELRTPEICLIAAQKAQDILTSYIPKEHRKILGEQGISVALWQ